MGTVHKSAFGYDIHGKPVNPFFIMGTVLLATFAGVLMQTSLGTALPTLMKDFNIDFNTVQQATTWFLLANGMMIPISAYLATRYPTKSLHIIAYGILLSGLIITASTPSDSHYWWIFLVGRIITAISVGMMMPLMQMLIIHMFPPHRRGLAMGLSGLSIGLAPAIGPTFAGWILSKEHVLLGVTISDSWRNIFVVPIVVVAIAWILSFFFIKDVIPNREIKLDIVSLVLSSIGFGLFLWGFTNVANKGWRDVTNVILPISISIVILIFFGLRQLKSDDPFLDLRVFRSRGFTIATISLILVTMAMFGVEMTLPTYLQNLHGLTPFESGLTLLAGAMMMGLVSPISGALYNKVGVQRLALVGFIILSIATLPFAFLSETTSPLFITVLYAIRMFAVALVMMPLTTSAMDNLPTSVGVHGTAVNNTARQVASSIAVALLTSVTQNIINTNMPEKSLQSTDPFRFVELTQQATMDGFNTAFAISCFFGIIGVFLVPFLKNKPHEMQEKSKEEMQ